CLTLIHTGMRRGEVGGLRWSWISKETITLPGSATKNHRELMLPNLINENLELIPKICEFVFPASTKDSGYSAWSDGKDILDQFCGVENFVLHDFRRYFSSTMSRLRVPIDVTEAMLNHVSGSRSEIQRTYDRHDRLPE